MAVVCAPWTKRRGFEQEKGALRDFRKVRALNVDDLEAWLECAPQTTVWLRELMGEPVAGISLLSSWWAQWLDSASPALDSGIVLAGRQREAGKLRDRCGQRRGGAITVGGRMHRDEIIAFVAAVLAPPDGSDSPADVLYVEDHGSAPRLLAAEAAAAADSRRPPLTVLVPSAEFARHLPAGSRHRMIVAVPGASQAEVVLGPVDSEHAAQLFEASGVEHAEARRLGSLARMSLMAVRRTLAKQPELFRPGWMSGSVDRSVRRCLLLGGWDHSRDGDRRVVERLAGRPYDEAMEVLRGLDTGDAPMLQTADRWHAVSPEDAWLLLDGHLTGDDIKAFGYMAFEVLTEPDPLWELAGDERLRARLDGTRSRFSPQIKSGVATTLALLGSRPPTLHGSVSASSSAAADIVWRVLRAASDDPTARTWHAVAEVLPLLAEAEPEAVLQSLRSCLSGQHAFAEAMFADRRSDEVSIPGPSPHLRVLEALEAAAWSPDHMVLAVDLLARLARIDPGDVSSKRPAQSLASIMCPWLPYTSAGIEARLSAIRSTRRNHPDVAWDLMLSMMPTADAMQLPIGGPAYRDWGQHRLGVTSAERSRSVEAISEMLLADVGRDASRWVELLDHSFNLSASLPAASRKVLVETLSRLASDLGEAFKSTVWPKLHGLVTDHRRLGDACWALPEAELADLDRLLGLLRPADHAVEHGWLFASGPMLHDGVSAADGWEAFHHALALKQADAVAAVLADGGVESVLEFAGTVELPGAVGIALASRDPSLDEAVLASMDAAPGAVTQAALAYFGHRFAELGWDGLEQLLTDSAPPPRVVADLLRSPPPQERAWSRVDGFGGEVAAEYWARVGYGDVGVPVDTGELVEIAGRLRGAGRCEQATILLSLGTEHHKSRPEFAQEAAACLEQLVEQSLPASWYTHASGLHLTTLLDVLDRHREALDTGRAAAIEWRLYPLIRNSPGFRAPNLYREMARDPEFFVHLVEMAFRPARARGNDPPALTETQRSVALNAYRALHGWPESGFLPGASEAGSVDAPLLAEWVERARERLTAVDRAETGDIMIGTALAASPPDPGDEWPGLAVRDLLESLQSDDIDGGLFTAVRNQRGFTRRSLTAGGDQERELAAGFKQRARHYCQWPRTAAIFSDLARAYEHEAGIHDREAEACRRALPL